MDGPSPTDASAPGRDADEPPPIVRRWGVLYALVIGELLLVILFCGWLATRGR